jgi:signal peptidase I
MHVSPEPDQKPSSKSFLLELPGLLLAALVVAILIKTFIVQPFYIPSSSMVPTLEINDRVMVSKLAYKFGDVHRGDIVVFQTGPETNLSFPENVVRAVLDALGIRTSGTEDLIKRVIALPSETIEIKDNKVWVDGKPLDEPYAAETDMEDMPVRKIPEGMIWVMGDHRCRNCSSDSRVFGPVDEKDIVGEAVLRIWPLDRISGL